MEQEQRPMQQGDSWAFRVVLILLLLVKFPLEIGKESYLQAIASFLISLAIFEVLQGVVWHLRVKWHGETEFARLTIRKDGSVWMGSTKAPDAPVKVAYVTDQEGRHYDLRFIDPMSATLPLPEDAD